ncbi:hypothetical protein glysoja_044925 [Glycine soja]|uniref:Uncharacterized protein n=1 Tax=Glycine soja TaxID=3848 RepID=A0A0B2RYF6_GLYSO|nr:hypothetical protein glysoja_044925 [Glycine soja]
MDSNNLFSDYFSDDLDSSPTVPTAVTTTTTTNAISSPSSLSTSSPTPGGSKKLIIKEREPTQQQHWGFCASVCLRSHFNVGTVERSGVHLERKWKQKAKTEGQLSVVADAVETVTNKLSGLSIGDNSGKIVAQGSIAIWKPKSYGTASGGTVTKVENGAGVDASVASMQKSSGSGLSKIYRGDLLENFTMDNSTYSRAQVRVTFNPKFENEKSDQVGLIPRAKLLLTIGGTFFLEFGPLILIIVATFSAIGIWVYFGY